MTGSPSNSEEYINPTEIYFCKNKQRTRTADSTRSPHFYTNRSPTPMASLRSRTPQPQQFRVDQDSFDAGLPPCESQKPDRNSRNKRYCWGCSHSKPLEEFDVNPTGAGRWLLGGQRMQLRPEQQLCHSCTQARIPARNLDVAEERQQGHIPQWNRYRPDFCESPTDHDPRSPAITITFRYDMLPVGSAKSKEEQDASGPKAARAHGVGTEATE